MNPPCRNCPRRTVGCHGSCDDYQAYKADREAQYEQRRAARDVTDARSDSWQKCLQLHRQHRRT